MKIIMAAASLALMASPCLAFTVGAAPVDSSGRSMLGDPDARLESTTSQMQDAYIQNNGGGVDMAAVRLGRGAVDQSNASAPDLGFTGAGTSTSDQNGGGDEGPAPIGSLLPSTERSR
ncbi:MAG: hypothetical protein P4M09_11395 [Devosia sp.]|nr:hypothetical protein [Devosia sp.]